MAADDNGNDLSAVSVPVTGLAAYAPVEATNVVADADMGKKPLALPVAFKKLGLYKVDGGPQDGRESGDAIEFFQEGYAIPGDGTRSVTITLAEDNVNVQQLIEGKAPTSDGVIYVDASLPAAQSILFVVTRYRNGQERRRTGVAQVTAVEVDQETRGEVRGNAVTFQWQPHDLFNNAPYKEWLGAPVEAVVIP